MRDEKFVRFSERRLLTRCTRLEDESSVLGGLRSAVCLYCCCWGFSRSHAMWLVFEMSMPCISYGLAWRVILNLVCGDVRGVNYVGFILLERRYTRYILILRYLRKNTIYHACAI